MPMVQRGEVILKEEPYVFVLKSSLRNEKCEFCFSPAEQKCSRCQYWRYCSKHCQKLAWSMHKLECDHLRKVYPRNVPDSAHMIIRILLRLKIDGSANFIDQNQKRRPFQDILSHIGEIRNDQRRMEHFTSVAFVVLSFFGETEVLNKDYLLELFGKVCINSFNIMDNDMNSVGTAIYLNASVLDHSCYPNAVATFNGTTIYIRSISDIPDFQMSNVKISYIDVLKLSTERRKELQSLYYFNCDCERCVQRVDDDLMQSMKCSNEKCSNFLVAIDSQKTKYICSECGSEMADNKIKEYHDIIQLSNYHIENMNSSDIAYIDISEMMLKKQEKILTDFNIRRVKMLDLAFEASINLQRWNSALKLGLQLLPAYRKYYGLYHPLVGLLNMKLLKLVLLENDHMKGIKIYEEAVKVLSVTHGTSHPLFENLKEIMYG